MDHDQTPNFYSRALETIIGFLRLQNGNPFCTLRSFIEQKTCGSFSMSSISFSEPKSLADSLPMGTACQGEIVISCSLGNSLNFEHIPPTTSNHDQFTYIVADVYIVHGKKTYMDGLGLRINADKFHFSQRCKTTAKASSCIFRNFRPL